MDITAIKKWLVLFCGILMAIIIADRLSNLIVAGAGMSGWSGFLTGFVVYAVLFFVVLFVLERVFRINFFGTGRDEN